MGAPEIIRIFEFADITKTYLKYVTLSLVIQSIFIALEPLINKKQNFKAAFQS